MRRTMSAWVAVTILLIAGAAGCSSSDDAGEESGGTVTTTGQSDDGASNDGAGNDAGRGAAGCSEYEGQPSVIRVFCDGPAAAEVTIDGETHSISGGTCEEGGGYLSFNAGVVTGAGFEGDVPDYIGVNVPEEGGDFTDITVAVSFDGATYALAESSGTADVDAGIIEFSGTAMGEDTEISGSLDCG
jgi:hypothetical protein